VHYHAGQIVAHLADRPDVAVSVERPEILETGGGLRAALPLLGEGPVFTLNTDAVWTGPNPLQTLSDAWDPARMDALLLLMPADRVAGGGGSRDFTMLPDGRLGRGGPFTYLGAQILQTAGLPAIEDRVFSLNRLWDRQIAAGRLFGLVHPGGWCDVGRPEGIAVAEDLLAADGHG
jgi:MurNAc alpha-1-phosphate uridylyltransferase